MLCVLATASAAAFGRKEGTLTVLRETNKEPEPRTCQGLSNYFGITSNMPFPACAPQGVRDWWIAHGCTTSAQVLRCNCGTCAPTPAAATPVIEAMRSATRAALSPAGSWTRHGTGWAWRDSTGRIFPAARPAQKRWSFATFPKAAVVLYGSSHTRELYLEILRVHFGTSSSDVCPGKSNLGGCETDAEAEARGQRAAPVAAPMWAQCLPAHTTRVGSRSPYEYCMHGQEQGFAASCNGWPPRLEGINIKLCGAPGFRIATELAPARLAVGFKTYPLTPETEAVLLERLQAAGMRHPDVAVAEFPPPWGFRGARQGPAMTEEQERSYYVKWVHEVAFPRTPVLWVHTCDNDPWLQGPSPPWLLLLGQQPWAIVVEKVALCKAMGNRNGKRKHADAGPVLTVLAQMLRDLTEMWLNKTKVVPAAPSHL